MFRKVLLTIGLLLAAQIAAFAQSTVTGTISDKNGEPLIGANVVIRDNGQFVAGARTDYDGKYTMKNVQVGHYDIEVSYVSYVTVKTTIDVKASGFTVYNEQMEKAGKTLDKVVIKAQKVPVIEIGTAETGARISSEDIGRMPSNSVEGIVAAVAGVGYSDGGTSTARGEEGMVTMQNGVRTRTGVNVPKEAIAEIQVILGGTPASIGEAIGGTQIITLKPPSTQFKGLVKYETYLDYRLWNSLTFYLSGPLAKTAIKDENGVRTGERALIGFRLTAVGRTTKFGTYRAKDGRIRVVDDQKVSEIENAPIVYDPVQHTVNYAAEYLHDEDFVTIKRPNARNYYISDDRDANFRSYSIVLNGALDFRFSEYTSLVLNGEFYHTYGPSYSLLYFPLNLHNAANGVSKTNNFQITAEFTQRFKDPEMPKDESNPDAEVKPTVSKVMYSINAMYGRQTSHAYNEKFGDDIFKYGHVGTFTRTQTPHYSINSDYNFHGTTQTAHVQDSWIETVTSFVPSEYNPILANYTSQLYNIPEIAPNLTTFDAIRAYNGLVNGGSPGAIYSLFYNVGTQNSGYSKSENNFYYVAAKASALIKGHDLEIGFQYDQYTSASYGLSAYSLWTLMRQSANAHITQLDFNNPIERFESDGQLYVDYNRLNGGGQTLFDQSLREALGLDVNGTDWLDIDRYSPDELESFGGINMFSANELFNSGNQLVSYYGFDHTGARYNSRTWSLDDFFDPVSRGHKDYQYLPAFSPIYAAGYIQDKFYFSDLIFNIGMRLDYFDGNQMVLKDPYLLYESYTVGQLRNGSAAYDGTIAAAADDDWVVYVNDANATTPTIRGYRDGGNWYNADGVQVSSHSLITGESGKATPYRTKGDGGGQQMFTTGNGSGNKISSRAFKDYDPQIVWMPRIAFSFPVNDMSQFKANYDIIARRPSSNWQADYMSYLFMNKVGNSYLNNPNLKPERVTNYEVGFQQCLNEDKTAAISLSAYYKETRDLIQLVQYAGADPTSGYYSYDNLDFKTVKGFSFSFDMRQSNNVRINANYTLQYAEGTGLSATTMSELIKEGYTTLKMLNPIYDDRRHEFKVNLDYRFGRGEGPKITRSVKDKDGNLRKKDISPLQNAGINFLAVAQSGRPYTRALSNTQSTIVGSYYGARMPWSFFFNVVVDKSWNIDVKTPKGKKRPTILTAAVTIDNLFDIRNVAGVFAVTGNPTDNGYLTDPETQSVINSYLDPQSFRDLYAIYLSNNYWYYSSPRTIRLTLNYQF